MNNGAFANEDVMDDYLSALLTEEAEVDLVQRESISRLLEVVAEETEKKSVVQELSQIEKQVEEAKVLHVEVEKKADIQQSAVRQVYLERPEQEFQVLYFNLAGLTLAIPLTELGGIHKLTKVAPLIGKPDWFNGIMLHREEKLSVVDTAKWIMPEKYDEKLANSLKYQYLIMLDDSSWGLACESLVTTVTLSPDDVKWRETKGKRPWLAGLVKEKMCALVDVKSLMAILDRGLGSNAE
jgi:purine-binding chemotaxis protein CheW